VELVVGKHPLKPTQSFSFHVERGNVNVLVVGGVVIIKKLIDLEDPTKWVGAVES
jgi:hypothetical protein